MEVTSQTAAGQDYAEHIGFSSGRFDLDSLRVLTAPRWQAWIADRLHHRDTFPGPDPRQGEEPEDLFIDLIPRLGAHARETAELGICAVLQDAIRDPWAPAPLSSLLFLIRQLKIGRCASSVLALAHQIKPENGTPPPSGGPSEDPYLQCLAALAVLQTSPNTDCLLSEEGWTDLITPNPNAYFASAFRVYTRLNPRKALQLLGQLDWTTTSDSIGMELASFLKAVHRDPVLEQDLRALCRQPNGSKTINRVLRAGAGNRWPQSLSTEMTNHPETPRRTAMHGPSGVRK